MKMKGIPLLLAVAVLLAAFGVAAAAPNPVLARHVFASGGQMSDGGGTLVLHSTIGEAAAGPLVISGAYGAGAGFLLGVNAEQQLYLPAITRGQ